MLKISIARIEDARVNPKTFAASLKDVTSGFGSKGTFTGTFKTFIGKFHNKEENADKLYQKLQDAYKLQFVSNLTNDKRAAKYCSAYAAYMKYMLENSFGLDRFYKRIDLKILSDVSIGGNSPILSSSDTRNMAFYIEEIPNNWEKQLKYPILQQYLANKYYQCEIHEVEIGIFNVNTGNFELKTFDTEEIALAFSEVKGIFTEVKKYYNS